MVIATQNPVEQEGTYLLAEAQLDRFLLKEKLNYPNMEEELTILNRIENNVFDNCKKLTKIHYDGTIDEWSKIELDNNWLEGSVVKEIICNDGTVNC